MNTGIRWIRSALSIVLFLFMMFIALNHNTFIYLIYQGRGQLNVLVNTTTIKEYEANNKLSPKQKENLLLVEQIKKYSVDSLAYKPTGNYSTIFDDKNVTNLWVITACQPYSFSLYEWQFPIVGRVSYKGFFKKALAQKEYNHLVVNGYDADLRSVSAWSTLGWLNDPLLSSMLNRSKGGLCNLLFHELFHATYYAPSLVSFNENMASFIAHKATLRFLKKDTLALNEYKNSYSDNNLFKNYMLRKKDFLQEYYKKIAGRDNKYILKLKAIFEITDSLPKLPLSNKNRYNSRKTDILKFKNAYFADFLHYDSMQDSLEEVFNKFYKGKIENLVRDLKLN
jgi:predicted aminopeptidase